MTKLIKPTTLITFSDDALSKLKYKTVSKCHACGAVGTTTSVTADYGHTLDDVATPDQYQWLNRRGLQCSKCGAKHSPGAGLWWTVLNNGSRWKPLIIRERVHGPLEDLFCLEIRDVNERLSLELIDATVSAVLEFLLLPKNIGYFSKTMLTGADFSQDPAWRDPESKTSVTYKLSRSVADSIANHPTPLFTPVTGPYTAAAIAYLHASPWLKNKIKEDTRFIA